MGMIYNKSTGNYLYDSSYPDDVNWLAKSEEGWSIVPEKFQSVIRENYPYIDVTCEEIEGVSTVTHVENLPVPPPPPPAPVIPTVDDITLLKAQVSALTEQNDFLEDCLVEMAGIVYDY